MNARIGSRESGVGGRESGQTATEYLMIAGIMTAIGLLVLLWFYKPWQTTVADTANCIRTDNCDAVGAK